MNSIDFKIDTEHKNKILYKTMLTFFGILICCYFVKVTFGLEIFKFVTNSKINKISEYVNSHLWADLLSYGILNFIMFYFITFSICNRFKIKSNCKKYLTIIYNLGLFIFCFVINILRYLYYSIAFGLFLDLVQYIIIPLILSKFVFKNNLFVSLFKAFETYLIILGIQNIGLMLNNMVLGNIYQSGFIVDFIFNFETYIFVILLYLKENYRRITNGSNT